jgi:hypothetical protein
MFPIFIIIEVRAHALSSITMGTLARQTDIARIPPITASYILSILLKI